MLRSFFRFFAASTLVLACALPAFCAEPFRVPILLYHRFGATVVDGMTITTPVFESHMKYLHDNGYTVIPLRQLVDHYRGNDLGALKEPEA